MAGKKRTAKRGKAAKSGASRSGRRAPADPLLPFSPIRNSSLFSNHWLENRLPLEPEWRELRKEAGDVLDELGKLWQAECGLVGQYESEATLEEKFIQPVLRQLGWRFIYQTFLRGRKPDYALYLDDTSLKASLNAGKKSPDFWNFPVLVADAKPWDASLDRPVIVNNQREYPPEQIEWYMNNSLRDFALLTNGRLWRLIPRQLDRDQRRFDTYLECDLARLSQAWLDAHARAEPTFDEQQQILDDFLRFYLFFSPTAFATVEGRTPLIERAIRGSSEYRLGVGEGLKERVFDALRLCIEGFVSHDPNGLDPRTDLSLCQANAFVLLYRLLFIMYAEDRLLLPHPANQLYARNRALRRHREDIAARLQRVARGQNDDFSRDSTDLWAEMGALFDLVDHGSPRYSVPPYNGGLFNPVDHPFLEENAMPDWYLARVIDQLSRAPDPERPELGLFPVDHRDLAIQHLGTIYEGLLELRPCYATEPMIVVRRSGRGGTTEERIIAEAAQLPDGFQTTSTRYATGEVYLRTDKGERRASGSYYTPNHIVDYIIEKTLGPICTRLDADLSAEIETTRKAYARARGGNRTALGRKRQRLENEFDDRVLTVRVLDAAIGSGHFLLRACQYLAEEIATNPHTGDPEADRLAGDESILTFWKRRVVERCLYGVDINPMAVELAKLALWLETVAVDQPLTFLDHHLRLGNSLVGADIESLGVLPDAQPLQQNVYRQQVEQRLPILLKPLNEIRAMPSGTTREVRKKEKLYRQAFETVRGPFAKVADLWCSAFFAPADAQIDADQYQRAVEAIGNAPAFRALEAEAWFVDARGHALRDDVRAFHWELEFPEVFFDLTGRRAEAGFDAIVGNPPYDVLSSKESGRDIKDLQNYVRARALYAPSLRGKNNLYKLFVCRALSLLANGGRLGFITPMAVLGDDQAAGIRQAVIDRGAFTSVDAFPQKDDPRKRVFPEAKLSTAIITAIRSDDDEVKAASFVSRVHPGGSVESNSPEVSLSSAHIPLYDASNLAIVSCSQIDWDLAVRIMQTGRLTRFANVCESHQGEVNEKNERPRGSLSSRPADGRQILRGANVTQYAVREASQGEDLYVVVQKFQNGKGPNTKAFHAQYERVGFQRSSPQNNFRRLIAAMIQVDQYCFDTVSYVLAHDSALPLPVVMALLNSNLLDWYFRLGSTNSKVNEYQFNNLPCPVFDDVLTPEDRELLEAALACVEAGNLGDAFDRLEAACSTPPFTAALHDFIGALSRRISGIEAARGNVARRDRAQLAEQSQPYQDLIDRLLFAMAGISEDEARELEQRLEGWL